MYSLKATLLASTILLSCAQAETPATIGSNQPCIEVVFVLDTTGSMSGLIAGAKQKIWEIANSMASAKPVPEIRMGLIGYRDRGDEYVTRHTQLTEDLDKVYADLMAYSANGGGDSPESVNQALHEAIAQMQWSQDEQTYRVVFLVGDCPPHMDYQDDVKYPQTCEQAARAGIVINTIQCGAHGATVPIWQEIAAKAEGRYFRVEQSGGAIVTNTPYDTELAKLAHDLDATRIYYGKIEIRMQQSERRGRAKDIYDEAPVAAQAARAVFNAKEAGKSNFLGANELINDILEGRVKLGDLKAADLPEAMRKLTQTQREEYVQKQTTVRAQVQEKIQTLAVQRTEYLNKEIAKLGQPGQPGFDSAIFECIKQQAAKMGIHLTAEKP
ncbi:MAG: vWA domain-containing protein [Planctomycetota bacterium]